MTDLQLANFTVGFLTVLLFGTQIFWARLALKLTDRVMSRDYNDFVQAESIKTRPHIAPKVPLDDDAALDPIAEDNARKANALLGL